jgi:hypothetical protein
MTKIIKCWFTLMFILFFTGGITQTSLASSLTASRMNPAIAAVGEFEAAASDDNTLQHPYRLKFNGGDLDIYAYVDPYFKAEVVIAFGEGSADFEEAYLASMTLPAGLKLRLGKFKAPFGKLNTIHAHALPIVHMPMAWERAFGEDGLNESGIALSEMIPFLPTYHEIIGLVLNGDNEIAFNGAQTEDLLYMGHLKNFFELGGYRTMELGLSFARGQNNASYSPAQYTTMLGANLILKWKHSMFPLEKALTLWGEIYHSRRDNIDADGDITVHTSTGFFILGKMRFMKRWYATALYDYSGDPHDTGEIFNNVSAGVAFQLSEFSEFKLEYRRLHSDMQGIDPINEISLLTVFTIGAHGPHAF